jgi:heavy metal efflux system protein
LFVLPILYVLFTENKKTKSINHIALMVVLFSVMSLNSSAQTPISYQEALDSAVVNNLRLKNENLQSHYYDEVIKTSTSLPVTDFSFQYGRINSFYNDNSLSISQSFDFPTVYSNQKKVNTAIAENSKMNVSLKEFELKQKVGASFYYMINLLEKKALLVEVDSIYEAYLKNANLRIDVGESNILEKVAIENQRVQISNQLKWLKEDIEVNKAYFQLLLNTKTDFIPTSNEKLVSIDQKVASIESANHPHIKLFSSDVEIAKAKLNLEKAKRAPSISIGLNSMTMYGTGSNNITYGYGKRFNSAQVGLGVPIFNKQSKQVKLAEISTEIAENNLEVEKQVISTQIDAILKQYAIQKEIVDEYSKTALSNAAVIFKVADQQLINGEIDYLEWAQLINQTTAIKSNYLNEVLKLNEISLQLIYLAASL